MRKLIIWLVTLVHLITFSSPSLAAEVTYYDTNNVGTPVVMWDSGGKKVWETEYYPFGQEYQTSSVSRENSHKFIGKEKDKETGLSYFGARYYDDHSCRFLTPDPVRPVDALTSKTDQKLLDNPQRLNRYAYGLNNPYRYVDSDGEIPIPLITGAIGAVIGGISNGATNWGELNGGKWWRSVAVGTGAGFIAGATGIGGAVVASSLNEVHEQTLRGKSLDNLDNRSLGYAAAGGLIAGGAGKTTAGIIREVGKKMPYNPSLLKPVDLKKMTIEGSKVFEKAGNISAVPASTAAENISQKLLKDDKKK